MKAEPDGQSGRPPSVPPAARSLTQREGRISPGLAQSVISDRETGENTNPSWDVLSKLSRIYDGPRS
jgi:hypothetical protein